MENAIYESFTLPSKGMIYSKPINPKVSLRSMTTIEEMKRLSPTDTPYKVMCDIIEDCMKEKPDIPVYNMSFGDYQFLLHKLRIVTYGPDYRMWFKCPHCGAVNESVADLESLTINEWTDEIPTLQRITLPKTGKVIELKFQTPKDLDDIVYLSKEAKKRTGLNIDYSILYTIMSLIKTVDGQVLNVVNLEEFVKHLPNMDANYIIGKAAKLNTLVGIDASIKIKCSDCGAETKIPFRDTSEFFGPRVD